MSYHRGIEYHLSDLGWKCSQRVGIWEKLTLGKLTAVGVVAFDVAFRKFGICDDAVGQGAVAQV